MADSDPIHFAAIRGDAAAIRQLAADGADVNTIDRAGVTPLFLAATSNRLDAVEALLELGADAEIPNPWGNTAITTAMLNDHEGDLIRALIAHGVNLDHKNNAGNSPRDLARKMARLRAILPEV